MGHSQSNYLKVIFLELAKSVQEVVSLDSALSSPVIRNFKKEDTFNLLSSIKCSIMLNYMQNSKEPEITSLPLPTNT